MSKKHGSGLSWYTLVVVNPDEGQTFVEYVDADSVREAVSAFWRGPFGKPAKDVYVAQVFEGKLRPCLIDWWIGHPHVWHGDASIQEDL
jgi:hypothetical protein